MKKESKIKEIKRKKRTGIVVSDKMDKTISVEIVRLVQHRYYQKRYKVHKKVKAHDEKNEYKKGDHVIIEECRPLSKTKKWKVIEKVK